jgi:hypothetical protein
VRMMRALLPMSVEESARNDVDEDLRGRAFRAVAVKSNLAPRDGEGDWRELVSVSLGNGGEDDRVGAVAPFTPPMPETAEQIAEIRAALTDRKSRLDHRSPDWAGLCIAQVLGLDVNEPGGRRRAERVLKRLINQGALAVATGTDQNRNARAFVTVP